VPVPKNALPAGLSRDFGMPGQLSAMNSFQAKTAAFGSPLSKAPPSSSVGIVDSTRTLSRCVCAAAGNALGANAVATQAKPRLCPGARCRAICRPLTCQLSSRRHLILGKERAQLIR
jgi:hypothetical protein